AVVCARRRGRRPPVGRGHPAHLDRARRAGGRAGRPAGDRSRAQRAEAGRARRGGARSRLRDRARQRPLVAGPLDPESARDLDSFLEMLAAERNAAANTREAYARDLCDFAAFLRRRGGRLASADSAAIRGYLAHLAKAGMATRTAARRLSALRQFYRFLAAEGRRGDDPAAIIDSPRQGRPLPKPLSEDEVARLIAAAGTGEDGQRLSALVELLYGAGLRVSELVGLPLAAVLRDDRVLVVRGKGGKERMIPIGQPARAAIAAWLAARPAYLARDAEGQRLPSPWLFPSRGASGHLTRQSFGQLLKQLAALAG